MLIAAFIPVKKYSESKCRLNKILSNHERAMLAKSMACKSVLALQNSHVFSSITVVTNDPKLKFKGTDSFVTEAPLNEALSQAIVCSSNSDQIMVMHADLPKINTDAIKLLVAHSSPNKILIVSDEAVSGTNCLIFNSSYKFDLQFGPNSYQLFLNEFNFHGYDWNAYQCDALQLDLDSEEDYFKLIDYVGGS